MPEIQLQLNLTARASCRHFQSDAQPKGQEEDVKKKDREERKWKLKHRQ
jgi:hypothetical protein